MRNSVVRERTVEAAVVGAPAPVLVADVSPADASEAARIAGADAPTGGDAASHGWRVLGVLSTLMGFASISTDVYLPALPSMTTSLKSDTGTMELTVAGYLIGFSLGQLLWGPLGDRHGRRGPVALGLLLFVLGSAGCALSGTATQMIAWRIVHEPHRVSRRLQLLRGWSHDEANPTLFP